MTNQKSQKFSNKAKAVVLGAAILASGAAGTFALLTDTSTTDINITSAGFGISVNDSATGVYEVAIDGENLKPGETRTGEITLKNDSTIPATVTVAKSALVNFTSDLKTADGEDFTTVTLAEGETVDLDLTVGLDGAVTDSPADESLKVTFNAAQ